MSGSKKIAFVGLGAMGAAMASNIARKQIAVTVFDTVAEKVDAVSAAGATSATSLAEAVKDADIVLTILPATTHVLDAVASPDGILRNMKRGGLYIDMSTIAPSGTDKIIGLCQDAGIRFMDAPVGRLAAHAARGESLFMVGCDSDADLEEARPIFDAMGTTIIRCGKAGNGIRIKVVNNFQAMSLAQLSAEAIVLGVKLGLTVEQIIDINGQTTATNGQMQVNLPSKVLIGDTEPGFTFDLAFKDLTLALDAAAELKLGLPVGAAAHTVYGSARATKFAKKDFSALVDYASELAGIEPPRLKQ